jgi:DNA transformation protein and related proteins
LVVLWFNSEIMPTNTAFANYCCDLLASVGRCTPKRMFGGFGISTDGLTIAVIADLGDGDKLWLKGDGSTRSHYETAGCKMFTYTGKGVPRTMNYFSSPEDAMDSADAMRPWAALALDCSLRARTSKSTTRLKSATKAVAKTAAKKMRKK